MSPFLPILAVASSWDEPELRKGLNLTFHGQ